ncbi:MAG: helix-turn-helix domain-containing protein [Bacteroidota bacterium]
MELSAIPFVINIFVGLVLMAVMLLQGRRSRGANGYLIALITIVLGYQFKAVIVLQGYYTSFPHFIKLFLPLHFLIGPLFYFYIKQSLSARKNESFELKTLLHYVPFLVVFLVFLPFYLKSGTEKLALHNAPDPTSFSIATDTIFVYIPLLVSLGFYSLRSIRFINNLKDRRDDRTNLRAGNKIKGLLNYSYAFLLFVALFFGCQLVFIFTDYRQFYVMLATVFASSIFVHFLSFWALKESVVIASHPTLKNDTTIDDAKYKEVKAEVLRLMEVDHIYLDSNMTAVKMAELLAINANYLSQIVNREFQCNLSFLLNSYRVSRAQKMLQDDAYGNLNFSGIASEAGFNSANSFTRVFKQHTGETPSQFKKSKKEMV